MSFDALTLLGISSSVLCGGFLIALVKRNDSSAPQTELKTSSEVRNPIDLRP
jgi:hypothetical protein